jgi:hypothetical protein
MVEKGHNSETYCTFMTTLNATQALKAFVCLLYSMQETLSSEKNFS